MFLLQQLPAQLTVVFSGPSVLIVTAISLTNKGKDETNCSSEFLSLFYISLGLLLKQGYISLCWCLVSLNRAVWRPSPLSHSPVVPGPVSLYFQLHPVSRDVSDTGVCFKD